MGCFGRLPGQIVHMSHAVSVQRTPGLLAMYAIAANWEGAWIALKTVLCLNVHGVLIMIINFLLVIISWPALKAPLMTSC